MQAGREASTRLALFLLVFAHAALTYGYALTRLYSYKSSLLDIGLFDQLMWNLLNHNGPVTTATLPFTSQHWLGFHFSPLLLALAPLYALWPGPETLQAIQSLAFALAGIPIFYAAIALGAKKAEAYAAALLYWCNPLVVGAALWDFHEISLSTLLIATAFWALCANRFACMLAALLLLLLTKEHYGICVAGFGFLWGWKHGDWKRGSALILLGLAATYAILCFVMPWFNGGAHAMLTGDGSNVVSRYGWLAGDWEKRITMFTTLLLGDGSSQFTGIMHLLLLLLSGLMFPLIAPFYLAPAAADMLANLLSTNPMPRHNASYHAAACIPVFVLAGMRGYLWIVDSGRASRTLVATTALALAATFPITGLTQFPIRIWELSPLKLTHNKQPLEEITALIGDRPVSAQANIGMFFSQRKAIYPFPNMVEQTGLAVLHTDQPFSDPAQAHFNIPYGMSTEEYVEVLLLFMAQENWHIAYWKKPWLVMQRGEATRDESEDRAVIQQDILDMMSSTIRPEPQNP